MIALRFTLLAHRFGIVRAFHPHRQAVREKARAIGAKADLLSFNLFEIEELEEKRGLFSFMVFAAENPDKFYENLNIPFLFFRDIRFFRHRLFFSRPFI
jgi:hypothetical protein